MCRMKPKPLLDKIQYPADLRKLKEEELPQLCDELREFVIDAVSKNPGHLGANLGVIELTVAIHYVFNTPNDLLVWDVGHQAYAHKILTGRKELFSTNRTYKGISGFPRMSESEYDCFGTGHSSTSISAVLGMAVASRHSNDKERNHIAVIGDGSLTGGMAFEALNHAGVENANVLVILNDNQMAIDQNVGALKEYLTDITTSHAYNRVKTNVWNLLSAYRNIGVFLRSVLQKIGRGLKSSLLKQSNLFESLNLRYFGPVDGHDVNRLVKILSDLKDIKGPKILHVLTLKGKGFDKAEKDQIKWHAPGYFDKKTGEIIVSTVKEPGPPKYQDVFGETILKLAEMNSQIVAVTPAMATGSSLNIMTDKMPERVFDVGIAEQHAVTFSAGMANRGLIPFCNIYSSFIQRAYDQIIHDVALQNLHVVFCLDRAGLVGEDGATHHGLFDIAYMNCIPNMIVSSPMNEEELRNLMYTAQLKNNGPFSIRYPRGRGVMTDWRKPFNEIPIGKGRKICDGKDIAVLSIGHIGNNISKIYNRLKNEGLNIAHYDMRFVKPLDEEILNHVFSNYEKIITVEDGVIKGGFGSVVLDYANEKKYKGDILKLGIPDYFVEQGTIEELQEECELDPEGIFNKIKSFTLSKIIH
ncbi:MAG: 1-deoxy-D-xylulose-5-phosphate synthase [Bacteroidales bacterium]|nr:1-deoxy-D-xylulose-5-phosphate synthase [Bacteroidales bacterium]